MFHLFYITYLSLTFLIFQIVHDSFSESYPHLFTRIPVITYLGHQPKFHKYLNTFVLSCHYYIFLVSNFSMAGSSSDNAEVDRALQAVTQNILSTALKAGDTSTHPR